MIWIVSKNHCARAAFSETGNVLCPEATLKAKHELLTSRGLFLFCTTFIYTPATEIRHTNLKGDSPDETRFSEQRVPLSFTENGRLSLRSSWTCPVTAYAYRGYFSIPLGCLDYSPKPTTVTKTIRPIWLKSARCRNCPQYNLRTQKARHLSGLTYRSSRSDEHHLLSVPHKNSVQSLT